MQRGFVFIVTRFRGAERGRNEASISHAGFPRDAATSAPDAADPGLSLHTTLLRQEGLAARWSVNKHVIEQHSREASKYIHGPGDRNVKIQK